MRIAASITLPDDLERARASGALVVFAGAGISIGPPALLPSFVELAKEIAQPPLTMTEQDEDALDKYLGRAERIHGVGVQERARGIFRSRAGSHNPLHEHLLGLFGTADKVRLITTNFDLHFTAAAAAVFGGTSVPHYTGPALPPGRTFRGIAHLHGSLTQEQDSLVLTDRDFAAAYMAEGWAARFLVGVFAERAVLFAGYSLSDPVMQYLLRALPTTNRWYALCHEDERARWADHQVVPVTFASSAAGNRFGDLNEGLKKWHWYAKAPASDHDQELRRIVALGPPTSPIDADYVRVRLGTEAGFATFWDAASSADWFSWTASEGILNVLTDVGADSTAVTRWADWALSGYLSGENPPLLEFLRTRSLQLHPRFAAALTLHLAAGPALPPQPVLRQLIALIANQSGPLPYANDRVSWLLKKLINAGYAEEAIALLRRATVVRLEPIERLQLTFEREGEPQPTLRSLTNHVGMDTPPGELLRTLDAQGQLLAQSAAESLVELGIERTREAYALLDLARVDGDRMDWLSYGRTAIAPSNQDAFGRAEDVLVMLIRVALDQWQRDNPARAVRFALRYSSDPLLLLRRLALYAVAESAIIDSDETLDRSVAEGWARVDLIRPEFYRAMRVHFARASEAARERLVAALSDDAWWGEDFGTYQRRARLSISRLLVKTCPASDSAVRFADRESKAHQDWPEGDPDGFLSRTTVSMRGSEPSRIGSDEMLRWSANDAVEKLAEEVRGDGTEEDRQFALLGALQQAARANSHWGVELLLSASYATVPRHLLEGMVWALRDVIVAREDCIKLLDRLGDWDWPSGTTGAVGSLLDNWSKNVEDGDDVPLLDAFDLAADRVYARGVEVEIERTGDGGWTERAINHPAGNAATAWWRIANARNRRAGEFILRMEDAERNRWKRVLDDSSAAGTAARVVLGMATDRLCSADSPWTSATIFPAFSAESDESRAAQLWDGRLMRSQWSWGVVAGLQPYLDAFLRMSAKLVPARAEQLGDLIGLLVTHPADSAFTLPKLQTFIQFASVDAREAFARTLPRHLERIDAAGRTELWDSVLSKYWSDRRTNVPARLSQGELVAMFYWVVALPEVASKAMSELDQTHGDAGQHADHLMWDWDQDSRWIKDHPDEAAMLISWLARRRGIAQWNGRQAVEHLETALKAGAARSVVLAAAEALAEVPCAEAVPFITRLSNE